MGRNSKCNIKSFKWDPKSFPEFIVSHNPRHESILIISKHLTVESWEVIFLLEVLNIFILIAETIVLIGIYRSVKKMVVRRDVITNKYSQEQKNRQ